MWKGVLAFGNVEVPVKFYSTTGDRSVRFRLLHAKDQVPVQQRMVNARTGEEVPYEKVRKGYEVDKGLFVLLDETEMEELEPEQSRTIEIIRFVEHREIAPQWYGHPYWLGPDGQESDYLALAEALNRNGREGIARWTMRKKHYVGALLAEDGHILLVTLRHAKEVVLASDLEAPSGRDLSESEVRMARQLVSALEGTFDPSEYRDEYRERVMDLIRTKARGGKVKIRKYKPPPARKSLEKALQESLRRVGRERRTA